MVSKSKARTARRLTARRARERERLAMAEGPRVVMEALRSPLRVEWALVGEDYARSRREGREVMDACRRGGVEVEIAPDGEVAALSTAETAQPVLAVVRTPEPARRSLAQGRHLVPSGVRNPGNLGALVRSALGFGLDGVAIGAGTVDPWNPKVVRASAGAVFHMPLAELPAPEPGARAAGRDPLEGATIFCADPGGDPVQDRWEPPRDWVLVLGGETGGLPARIARRARAIGIPMEAGLDSLNVGVAGSILMYLMTRRGR